MRRIAVFVVAALGLSGAAYAADLPVPVEEVPFVPTVEGFSWTGAYVGLNLGYAFGRDDDVGLFDEGSLVAPGFQGDVGTLNPNGIFGGFQVGYNQQFGRFVAGIEADWQLSSQEDDLEFDAFVGENGLVYSGSANNDQDWFGTLRGRAGVAFDRVFLYGTGGLAFANREYSLEVDTGARGADIDADESLDFGYVLGAGAEFALTNNLSAKAEYQFIDIEDEDFAEEDGFGTDPSVSFHTVRVGVNYRFNGLFQ